MNASEFIQALQEFLSSKNGASNDMNMNTSFSVSSHAMRQRKLLRKATFELQNLAPSFSSRHHGGGNGDGDDYDGSSVRYTSFFSKASSIHNVQLDDDNGCEETSSANISSMDDQNYVVELVLQVMQSVNGTIIEEYMEQLEECKEQQEAQQQNRQPREYQHVNNTTINLNQSTVFATSMWNANPTLSQGDKIISENLQAALEFLEVAYGCLDPSVVFESLTTCVDASALDLGVNVNVNTNSGVGMGMGIENGCDDDNDGGHYIMDALLHFITHSRQMNEDGYDESESPRMLQWDKLQTLSLSVMVKGILCAEYIQKYCTSLSVLPTDGYDSLLGRGMGIINNDHCEQWEVLLENVVHALGIDGNGDEAPTSNSKMDTCFRLSCMALLSVYYRTSFIPLEVELNEKMVDRLYDDTQGLGDYLDGIGLGGHTGCSAFTTSVMALSLLVLIQSSPVWGDSNQETLVIEGDTMEKLFSVGLGVGGGERYESCCIEGALEILIHMCSSRHNSIRYFSKNDSFLRIISNAIHDSILVYYDLVVNDTPWQERQYIRGKIFVLIHLNQAITPTFRKAVNSRIKSEAGGNSMLVKRLLDMATDSSLTIPSILFIKSLMLQSIVNGQWQLRDDLSSAIWNSIVNEHTRIQTLSNQILSRYNHRANHRCIYITMDFLNFLFCNGQFNQYSEGIIGDDIVAVLVKILKKSKWKVSNHIPLSCSLHLGAATLLSRKCLHQDQEGNTSVVKRLLNRFATNSLYDDNQSSRKKLKIGVIEYALNQSITRDLVRRAINLQSILSVVRDEDSFDTASTIFDTVTETETKVSSLKQRLTKVHEDLNEMNEHCKKITTEKDYLSEKLANATSSFQRELKQKISMARADALDMAQVQADEKKELLQHIKHLQDQLTKDRENFDRVMKDTEAERLSSKRANEELKSRICVLQEQLVTSEQLLENSNLECREKDTRLRETASRLEDAIVVSNRIADEKRILIEDNSCRKQQLEEALVQLISMTQIYNSKERDHGETNRKLSDELSQARHAIQDEAATRHRAEEKYSQLKEKYIQSREKFENEIRRRDEERKRDEKRRRDEERRREDLRRREDDKIRDDGRKSQKNDDGTSSRRRKDGRKPMGTLEFMNSLHDTSISERNGRDESLHHKKQSSRSDSRSSRRSGFRIVR